VAYAYGIGGLVAAAAGEPAALLLLVIPAFMRFVILPLIRGRDRDVAEAFFRRQALVLDAQLSADLLRRIYSSVVVPGARA
jgi:hypothetical protein